MTEQPSPYATGDPAAPDEKRYHFTRKELEAFAFQFSLLSRSAQQEPDWLRHLHWYLWRLTDIALHQAKLGPDPGVVTAAGDFTPRWEEQP